MWIRPALLTSTSTGPKRSSVRSNDALYRFIYGFDGSVILGHHFFADGVDPEAARHAWQTWLERLFGPSAGDGTTSD